RLPRNFFHRNSGVTLCFLGLHWLSSFSQGLSPSLTSLTPAYKDTRIFMMGASMPFLDNVRKAVNEICTIHALKHDFVGERDLVFGTYYFILILDELSIS
ncbi:hypothetical protein Anas_13158, partial [Armadillidium nasatum]